MNKRINMRPLNLTKAKEECIEVDCANQSNLFKCVKIIPCLFLGGILKRFRRNKKRKTYQGFRNKNND